MQYTASTKGYRKFDLLDEYQVVVGRLDYESIWSGTAKIIINEREAYQIRSKGFWGMSKQILRSGMPYAELKPTLRGGVDIILEYGKTLHFKRKSVWHNEYILTDDSRLLAELKGVFSWKKWTFDYTNEVYTNMLDKEINTLIPFMTTYCAMYMRRLTSAAT